MRWSHSQSSWHVNPILQILALSEKHPKIWDGACLEIHLTPFLNNKLGIAGRGAPSEFLPRFALSLSEQHKQTKKKEKKTNRQKREHGFNKRMLLMLNSQPGSKPTSSAVKHSFPGLQCCATKLITTRRWQHRCHHDHQIDDHHHDHHRVTVILLGNIAGIKIINLLYSMHSTHSVYLHFVVD